MKNILNYFKEFISFVAFILMWCIYPSLCFSKIATSIYTGITFDYETSVDMSDAFYIYEAETDSFYRGIAKNIRTSAFENALNNLGIRVQYSSNAGVSVGVEIDNKSVNGEYYGDSRNDADNESYMIGSPVIVYKQLPPSKIKLEGVGRVDLTSLENDSFPIIGANLGGLSFSRANNFSINKDVLEYATTPTDFVDLVQLGFVISNIKQLFYGINFEYGKKFSSLFPYFVFSLGKTDVGVQFTEILSKIEQKNNKDIRFSTIDGDVHVLNGSAPAGKFGLGIKYMPFNDFFAIIASFGYFHTLTPIEIAQSVDNPFIPAVSDSNSGFSNEGSKKVVLNYITNFDFRFGFNFLF